MSRHDPLQSGVAEHDLLLDILLLTAAAFLGGAIAQGLRLPTIIGFLAAGVAIGPNTPGPVGDVANVSRAADIGVVLLMFGIGVQFSFRQLLSQGRLIVLGGGGQVASTLLLGLAAGRLLDLSWEESLILGFLVAISSTVVAIKVLEGRQQMRSLAGIATINVLILQDIAAVLMVIVVPSLAGVRFDSFDILIALLKGLLLVAVAYVLSARVLPGLWRRITYARSRELSLLAALTLAVGLATGSALLGLSVAFGAFLAGLAISESEYGYTALSDIIPLREVFASVFFISMGMLIEPETVWDEAPTVAVFVVLIVLGKGALSAAALKLAGLALAPALLAGLYLAQVGEFSFVIARAALGEGVIQEQLASAFLVAGVLTILLSPGLVRLGPPFIAAARRLPALAALLTEPAVAAPASPIAALRRHVVICGYGGAAVALVRSLSGRGLPFVVIDSNPFVYETVRRNQPDVPIVYGDATRPEVLELARVREARVLAVTLPNVSEAQLAVAQALSLNPNLDVVSRGSREGRLVMRTAGSAEVIDPEFEASLEFVRHVLHRFGVDGREIAALQARWRAEHYGVELAGR